ncbi:MAG TPA: DUF5063 domain-containing protein [Bacteroidales bacterium]|nr:DUF5063 domain-containing protein [Bacteroidales bacterium]
MENEDILKEPVYSPFVLEFVAVAQKYCLFIEEIDNYSVGEIFDYMHKALSLLYVRGSVLPKVTPEHYEANEKYVTEEQWQNVFNALREKLGKDDEYWFNENDNPLNELIKGSLADGFTDIYQDMRDFVLLYQKPLRDAKKVAVWEMRELFQAHWGFRIVNLLKVLHYNLYSENRPTAMTGVDGLPI